MKEDELRELAECANCKKKLGETGMPLFFKVTIERYGLNKPALDRLQGMTQFFGGHAQLASVMGADEDLAKRISGPRTVMICESCAGEKMIFYNVALGDDNEKDEEED